MIDPARLKDASRKAAPETKKLFAKLKKSNPRNLDEITHALHDEVFERVDCLVCANCCKTTSPIFTDKDIERLAKHLRIKPSRFSSEYLHLDEENHYVLNAAPCPFLGNDNYCSVYEARPNACREYPHTNRKKFYQLLNLSLKNTEICPAVYEIVEELKKKF